MTKKEAIANFLEKVKLAYIEDQQAKGIRASGQSAQLFRTQAKETGGTLYGAAYLHFQKQGRRPGGFPPIESILQWIKDKGIKAEISNESLAFLIARKIARLGTDIYRGKRPALNVDTKIEELRKELVQNIINSSKKDLIDTVVDKLGYVAK